MKKTLGKIFRMIRESKGLSQKEVAEGIVSIAQLSGFEHGINDVTVDVLYICLQNMDVTIGELWSVYHNFVQPQDTFLQNDISEAYLEKNILKLEKILENCKKLEERFSNCKLYKLNTLVVKAILSQCTKQEKINKEEIQYLVDYLFSVEERGRCELWLFTDSASVMTVRLLETPAEEMVKRTQSYQEIPENRRLIIQILLSVISVCIEKEHFSVALKLLNCADRLEKPEIDFFENVVIRYYRGCYLFKMGNSDGLATMEKCTEITMFSDCYNVAQQMQDTIAKLKSN